MRPVWSPDGAALVFSSNRKGHYDLYRKSLDGSAEEEALLVSERDTYGATFTGGGSSLLFTQVSPETGFEMQLLPLGGSRKPEQLRLSLIHISEPTRPD